MEIHKTAHDQIRLHEENTRQQHFGYSHWKLSQNILHNSQRDKMIPIQTGNNALSALVAEREESWSNIRTVVGSNLACWWHGLVVTRWSGSM